jgi:filamentous hemagglutinin family protein
MRRFYADIRTSRHEHGRGSVDQRRVRLRKVGLGLPLAVALGGVSLPVDGQTLPQGGAVVGGSGSILQVNPSHLQILQNTHSLAIDWQSFNVGAGSIVRFLQPDSSSIALNRVLGPDPSRIFGQIQANGQVVILNPSGIYFGPNSRVDVSGLVATTANVRNQDFMLGRFKFDRASANADARVVNEGVISVAQGGFAVLAGAGVRNAGQIVANGGTVVLAGTKTFAIDFHGDGLLSFAATGLVEQVPSGATALVDNSGVIEAVGGRVLMTARAARNVLDNVINTTGLVVATSAQLVNGQIVIDGGDVGIVNVAGTLDASGNGAGETGGTVKVLGEKVALLSDARIDVSGDAGGGTALVGGNYQGRGPEPNATIVYMDARAVIDASAATTGDGGKVVLWADDAASVAGRIFAHGGLMGGDGGRVETSGKNRIAFGEAFVVDTTASFGKVGTLLVDPTDFVIANTGGDMTPAVLAGLLGSTDVTIQSTTGSGGTTGTIYLNNNLSISAGTTRTLTLNAVGGIEIGANITSNSYALNLQLNAGSDINVSGSVQIYGGYLVTNLTGGVGLATGNFTNAGAIDVGAGNITLNHTGNIGINAPVTLSGSITVNAIGNVTQGVAGAITGSPSLTVGGTGMVALTHASNDFSNITLNRTSTYNDVNLLTAASPNILSSTIGLGNYSLTGSGFSQTGSITQDFGASGSVTISGSAGSVILSNANSFSGDLLVSGSSIYVRAPQTFNNLTAKTASFMATAIIEVDGTNTNPNYYTGAIAASGVGSLSTVLTAGTSVTVKGSVTSNGGNITIWGNAPGGDPSAGVGASGSYNGVLVADAGMVSAGGGNIEIAGRGGNTSGAWGIGINNGQILTTGSGTISLTGLGDTSGPVSLIGVGMQSSALVQTHDGNLTITGTGGNGVSIGYNSGVLLSNSSINVSGNGNILLTGTGGANANTESIYLSNSSISSAGTGNIVITAPTPAGGGTGMNLLGSSVEIGGVSFQGELTLATNSISSTASTLSLSRQAGGGTIVFKPAIDSNTIGVNGGTGSLSIAGSIVSAVSGYRTLQIGSTLQTGDIDIGATTFSNELKIRTQGAASSAALNLGGNNLVIVADSGYTQGGGAITTTGTVTFSGGGDVTATHASNSIGTIVIDKAGSASNVAVVTSGLLTLGASSMGTGTLSLTGNGFSQVGGIIQDPGGGSIALDAGTGTLALNQLNIFRGNLTASAYAVTVSADQTFANSGTQTASLTANNGPVIVQAGMTKINNGGLSVYVDAHETVLFDNAGILSNGGDVRIWGNAPGGSTSAGSFAGSAWGVKLDGASAAISADGGTIDIVGKGSSFGAYQHGIVLINGASIQTTTGAITLQGRGGDGSGGGAMGIFLADGSIATQSGNLMLAGWGGTLSANGHGIALDGTSSIVSSAGSNLTLSGVGKNGGVGLTAYGTPSINSGTGTLSFGSNNGIDFGLVTLSGSGGGTLNGGTESIAANNPGNQLSGTVTLDTSAGNAAALSTMTGYSLDLGTLSIAGDLSITSGGTLTQSGTLSVGGNATFTSTADSVLLADNGNFVSGTVSIISGAITPSNVFYSQAGNLSLGTISTPGTLTVSVTGGSVSQILGSISAGMGGSITASNGITFSNSSNSFGGPLSLNVSAGIASVSAAGNLQLGAIGISDALMLSVGGTIGQVGTISVGSAILAASGAMTLLDAMNNFGSTLALSGTTGNILGLVGSVTASSGIFSINGQSFGSIPTASSVSSSIVTADQQASIVNTTAATAISLLSTLSAPLTLTPPLAELRSDVAGGAPQGSTSNEEAGAQPAGSLLATSSGQAAQEGVPATGLVPVVPAPAGDLPQPQIYLSVGPSNALPTSDVRPNPAPQASPIALVPGVLVLNPSTLPTGTIGGGIPGVTSAFPTNGNQALW